MRLDLPERIFAGQTVRANLELNVVPARGDAEKQVLLLEQLGKTDGNGIIYTATIKAAKNGLLPLVTLNYTYQVNGLGPTFEEAFAQSGANRFADNNLGISILVLLGLALIVVGRIWIIVLAFQCDSATGALCIFFPFYTLRFVAENQDDAGKPFLVLVIGVLMMVSGVLIGMAVH